ncbi:hypothetical protein C8R46DRAFT_1030606 [Mycena filopes]|nr:hypothetical protein C8R46DRAFT_1030606 [Mycena filopes]
MHLVHGYPFHGIEGWLGTKPDNIEHYLKRTGANQWGGGTAGLGHGGAAVGTLPAGLQPLVQAHVAVGVPAVSPTRLVRKGKTRMKGTYLTGWDLILRQNNKHLYSGSTGQLLEFLSSVEGHAAARKAKDEDDAVEREVAKDNEVKLELLRILLRIRTITGLVAGSAGPGASATRSGG